MLNCRGAHVFFLQFFTSKSLSCVSSILLNTCIQCIVIGAYRWFHVSKLPKLKLKTLDLENTASWRCDARRVVEVEAKRKPDGKIISWPEVPKGGFLKKICQTITLPKTNSSPLQMGWLDYYFPIGEMLVSGRGYPPGNFTSHGTHLKRNMKIIIDSSWYRRL